jgi:hypothetical protein
MVDSNGNSSAEDADRTVAGIVTLDDLVVLLSDELDSRSVVEAESPPY